MPVSWGDADVTAVVVLVDKVLAHDTAWSDYVQGLFAEANNKDYGACVFPVTMEPDTLGVCGDVQAFRWDRWEGSDGTKEQRLKRELTGEFVRMLRFHLGKIHELPGADAVANYLTKINVFLSHSKHDDDGVRVATELRNWIHNTSSMDSFFDVYDIPPGLSSSDVIDHSTRRGALLTIYTDSYSSREWCRREVISSKRNDTPMIVVNCLQTKDERAFPYLGNVPVIPNGSQPLRLPRFCRRVVARRGVQVCSLAMPRRTYRKDPTVHQIHGETAGDDIRRDIA